MTRTNNTPKKAEVVGFEHHGSLTTYIVGFVLSVGLTLAAYFSVTENIFEGWLLTFVIVELGIVQLFVQLILFLHLGQERKPRWNLVVFLFMVLVLGILVVGSLWIMDNLNYHMKMSPDETNKHLMDEESIYK